MVAPEAFRGMCGCVYASETIRRIPYAAEGNASISLASHFYSRVDCFTVNI